MKINPFESHPLAETCEKNSNNILTLEQIRNTVMNKMVELRAEDPPPSGYDSHFAPAILLEILFEMEEKCLNS